MAVGRVQREEIRSGRKEGKRFEGEGGAGVLHQQRGPDGPSSTVEVYKLEESKEEDTVLVGVRSPKETGTQHGRQQRE